MVLTMAATIAVQCKGTAKSTKGPCTKKTKKPSGFCGLCTGVLYEAPQTNASVSADLLAAAADDATSPDGPDPDAPITPLDAEVTPGVSTGEPFLFAGADLYDSVGTVTAYRGTDGDVHEVMHLRLTPEGEAKMLEALAIGKTKSVPVETHHVETGPSTIDTELGLQTSIEEIARSINARMKNGESPSEIASVNEPRIEALMDKMKMAEAKGAPPELLNHCNQAIEQFTARLDPSFDTPYTEGGKIPQIEQWQGQHTVTKTEWVDELVTDDLSTATLPVTQIKGKRIAPWIENGEACWDGSKTVGAPGEMWKVNLGDGYVAYYKPTALAEGATGAYSMRRRMTIIAPKGQGRVPGMAERLQAMNLVNEPMTHAEAEYTYLENVAYAMGNGSYHPAVENARRNAARIEDLEYEKALHNHTPTAGENPAEAARKLRLQAERAAIKKKTKILREAVGSTHGFGDGDSLAASPGYDPLPKRSGGWVTWRRPDVAEGTELGSTWRQRTLVHRMNKGGGHGGGIVDVLDNSGVLASQERRRQFGTPKGLGWSESEDASSGGASTTFGYIMGANGDNPQNNYGGARVVWEGEQMMNIAARTDWYATSGDSFGATNAASTHSTSSLTRNPKTAAGYTNGGEMMFFEGLDLLGSDAPTRIHCGSDAQRSSALAALKKKGVTHIGGRPVEKVVLK